MLPEESGQASRKNPLTNRRDDHSGTFSYMMQQHLRLCHAGGDAFMTICLWKLGFAHTDPGPWFNDPRMRLFDAAESLSSHELASRLFDAADGSCEHSVCQARSHSPAHGGS